MTATLKRAAIASGRLPALPAEAWPAVSILLTSEKVTTKGTAAAARLRSLLAETRRKLDAVGVNAREAQAILAPAERLLEDAAFWRHQDGGLAIYLGPDLFEVRRLPFPVPELAVVARHFHLRPLLPLAMPEHRFWILAVSAGRVQLLCCTEQSCEAADLPDAPEGVDDIGQRTEFEPSLQYAPQSRPRRGGAPMTASGQPGTVSAHGFESPADLRKIQLVEYLDRCAAAAAKRLADGNDPLILAAEPEALGHLRKSCGYRRLCPTAIEANPFAFEAADLHRRALDILHDDIADGERLRDLIDARLESAEPTATLRIEEIVTAAAEARVAALVMSENDVVWGRVDPATGVVAVHRAPQPDDEDLVNLAALNVLNGGGEVHVLPRGAIPHEAAAAAALRY